MGPTFEDSVVVQLLVECRHSIDRRPPRVCVSSGVQAVIDVSKYRTTVANQGQKLPRSQWIRGTRGDTHRRYGEAIVRPTTWTFRRSRFLLRFFSGVILHMEFRICHKGRGYGVVFYEPPSRLLHSAHVILRKSCSWVSTIHI